MKNKVNISYLLTYILVGIMLFFLVILFSVVGAVGNSDWIVIPILLGSVMMVLWFALVPIIAPSVFRNTAYKKLAKSGFKIEKIYKNYTYSLLIDISGGMVAIIYSFNPITPYIFSAKRIQKIWIHEDKRQPNQDVGTVGVRFIVDNEEERFDTYNQTKGKSHAKVYLPQNHPNIIAARQNAHNIVCELEQAWRNAPGFGTNQIG
ncbi:MAG: hypothetical protein IJA32_12425 [Lachnospiraceae bacterium]|nr:hypothetical protein [Lachnospiraceae bacterium]